MQDLTASIPHQLTRAEAKQRVQAEVETLRRQQGALLTNLQEVWTGDTMSFSVTAMAQSISGRVTVDDGAVHLVVSLPWLLRLLAGPLKQKIEQCGSLLLKHR